MRLLLFSFFLFLFTPISVGAASFIIDSQSPVASDASFKVDILLDANNSELNAVGGVVFYQNDRLILEDVLIGGSLVSLWLDQPEQKNGLDGNLEFNGIIPGGYNGSSAYLFSLIFRPIKNVSKQLATISVNNAKVFLNDGAGTEIKVASVDKDIAVSSYNEPSSNYQEAVDKFPPEDFSPMIYNYGGETYMAFSSSDRQSGLSHYEIAFSDKLTNNYQKLSWTKSFSPRIMKADDLSKFIYIKAVDKQGNFKVSVLKPSEIANSNIFYLSIVIFVSALILVTALVAARRFVIKK